MSFKHITAEDRSVIATLLYEQGSNSYIARRIGVHRSTISREIKRNQIRPKPPQAVALPVRPTILDMDCRHVRGSGLAQDKHEAAVRYAAQVRVAKRSHCYYTSSEANRRAVSRRTRANSR